MQPADRSTELPSRLRGRYALVTGASQGIGRAIAIRFAQEGATVAIAFLASDEASYITDQTIYACGGLTLFGEFRETWAS